MTSTAQMGDTTVKRIGFGAMQLAGPGVMGPPQDPEAAAAVLRRAIELGVDHIDTSQFYGPNHTNQLIHDTLHPYPDDLKLVSKIGARRDEKGAWLPAFDEQDLRDAVDENLATLEVDSLALVNLRLQAEGGVATAPTPDQLDLMVDLRDAGKFASIGLSNVTREGVQIAIERGVEIGQVQNAYSIVDRSDQAVLDLCREHGIAYVPFFPLGSAFTGGPAALAKDESIKAVADKHDALPTQVALAWLLAIYDRLLLIPGTTSVAHLEENVAAAELELDADDLERLESVQDHREPMAAH
jgi:pyridoxine 4-dehydrogenase